MRFQLGLFPETRYSTVLIKFNRSVLRLQRDAGDCCQTVVPIVILLDGIQRNV